jgi:undecaprenyl-diphosphatase
VAIWAVAGSILLGIGIMLGLVAAGPGVLPIDADLLRAVQQPASDALDRVAWVVSRVGDGFPAMALLALIAVALLTLRGRNDLALYVGVAAALRALNPALKWLAGSARPPGDLIAAIEQTRGLGWPSGHAFGAALFYGAVAVVAPAVVANRVTAYAFQAIFVTMILLTAWARVRLGVHWPSDVVGGVLLGAGLVCLLRAAQLLLHERGTRSASELPTA